MINELEYLLPFLEGITEKSTLKRLLLLQPEEKYEFKPHKAGWLVDFTLSTNQRYTCLLYTSPSPRDRS